MVVTRKLAVNDMQCQGCAGRVVSVLMANPGVVKVITSLDDHTAEVTYDEKAVSGNRLLEVLKDAGFCSTENKCC